MSSVGDEISRPMWRPGRHRLPDGTESRWRARDGRGFPLDVIHLRASPFSLVPSYVHSMPTSLQHGGRAQRRQGRRAQP